MADKIILKMSLCLVFLFAIQIKLAAQKTSTSTNSVADNLAKSFLKENFISVNELSAALTQSFSSDSEKVRSIFIYITHSIEYDVNKRLYFIKVNNDSTQTASYTLRKRKAVCEGYANLFKELCLSANIKAEFIGGYSRNEEDSKAYPHAWNAALINNEWKLFDPTWAAGGVNTKTKKFNRSYNKAYFMIAPQKLVKSHYPDDPMWQLLAKPVTRDLFEKKKTASEINFSFNDTINNYYISDSLTRTASELNRMVLFDPENEIYLQQLNHLYETIEVDKMDKANQYANDGITLLNDCAKLINEAKRKRNTKLMNDNENFLIDNANLAKEKFNTAIELYKNCKPTLQSNKNAVKTNIAAMQQNVEAVEQNKKYLLNYYGTPKALRIKVL